MRKNVKTIIAVGMILVVMLLFSIIIWGGKDRNNNEVKIKDNVNIITTEMESDLQPVTVTEDTIVFNHNPKYKNGDVIVAGIIDAAPTGFIRRVVSVSESKGVFEYKTENAVLTDVFEEAHIIKTFIITENDVLDIDEIDNGVMTLNLATTENEVMQSLVYSEISNANIEEISSVKVKPNENGLGVVVELDDKIDENIKVNGRVEVNTYLEIKIDIEDGEIDFGMALHNDTEGELFVGCKRELFDKDNIDEFNGEYEKELLNKKLPNIEFLIGTVPVVLTNDLKLSFEVLAQLEGKIGTSVGISAERISGFEYSSETGSIEDINEKKYLSDGMEWKTEAKADGELEAGIYTHLITKLYGSTGTDLSVGICGNLEGELGVGIDENLASTLYGSLALSVNPKVSGKIVVTEPVVDYNLLETEILKVKLPAFWEEYWESSANWKDELNSIKNVYITKGYEGQHPDEPIFQFEFPNNWSITKEEIGDYTDTVYEVVELTNSRGVVIRYAYFNYNTYFAGIGRDYMTCEIEKVSDSNVKLGWIQGTDYSEQGKMVVAKVHNLTYGDVTGQYIDEWDEYIFAVVPESYLNWEGYSSVDEWQINNFSFRYASRFSFVAHSPDGKFTLDEEKEIIEILSSLKEYIK